MAGDRDRPGLPDLPLPTLRSYRNALRREESRVSYWRRLVHARLDLARAGAGGELTRYQVQAALGDGVVWHRRLALMAVEAGDALPALPDLGRLCSAPLPGPGDDEATALLAQAERQLSAYRTAVHRLLDDATAELVARYRADPRACLSVLPAQRPGSGSEVKLHR